MSSNQIKIDQITVEYGVTTVQEIMDAGYTICDFAQITEEPAIASCSLYKNGSKVATICFYSITETIDISSLSQIPIDLVLPENEKSAKNVLTPKQAQKNRMVLTVRIHLIAAAVFSCIYAVPALFHWVQNSRVRGIYGGVGMILLVLPALIITFLCGGGMGTELRTREKIKLSLGLILHVGISLAYLVLIHLLFTQIL